MYFRESIFELLTFLLFLDDYRQQVSWSDVIYWQINGHWRYLNHKVMTLKLLPT